MSVGSEQIFKKDLGSLRGCLVEGDAEQRTRERRVRRGALLISVFAQSAVLAAVVIMPLFARTPGLLPPRVITVPEIFHPGESPGSKPPELQNQGIRSRPRPCLYCPVRANPVLAPLQSTHVDGPEEGGGPFGPPELQIPGAIRWGPENNRAPQPPVDTQAREATRRLKLTRLQPAMLVYRVEPVYPLLAIQMRRSGQVQLRAIISTDGTIQSLQVVSGDPFFYSSALDAVRQWRYKPTILNGQPFEVETLITVIYNMQ